MSSAVFCRVIHLSPRADAVLTWLPLFSAHQKIGYIVKGCYLFLMHFRLFWSLNYMKILEKIHFQLPPVLEFYKQSMVVRNQVGIGFAYRDSNFKLLRSPGINSARLLIPAGPYHNPFPTRFLAPHRLFLNSSTGLHI
jgi:hypothetical protein